jgi:hypothetical protein
MGLKTMQVKRAGSQSFPAPAHISPQCGLEGCTYRSRICSIEVVTGVIDYGNPHLLRSIEVSGTV